MKNRMKEYFKETGGGISCEHATITLDEARMLAQTFQEDPLGCVAQLTKVSLNSHDLRLIHSSFEDDDGEFDEAAAWYFYWDCLNW
jgi:hypothetical protein